MAGVAIPNNARNDSVSPPLVDWRKNCPGVNGKLKHLLHNELLTDVSFRVGGGTEEPEVIRAHRLMLAMFSSVFEIMFMGGPFIEKSICLTDPIELPDIHPSAFKNMLKVKLSIRQSCRMSYVKQLDYDYALLMCTYVLDNFTNLFYWFDFFLSSV